MRWRFLQPREIPNPNLWVIALDTQSFYERCRLGRPLRMENLILIMRKEQGASECCSLTRTRNQTYGSTLWMSELLPFAATASDGEQVTDLKGGGSYAA